MNRRELIKKMVGGLLMRPKPKTGMTIEKLRQARDILTMDHIKRGPFIYFEVRERQAIPAFWGGREAELELLMDGDTPKPAERPKPSPFMRTLYPWMK